MGQYLQLDMRSGQRKAPKAAVAVLDTQIAIASPIESWVVHGIGRGFSEGLVLFKSGGIGFVVSTEVVRW